MCLDPAYLTKRISVEEVLRQHDFSHTNADFRSDWERLKAKMQPGDELWRFEPPPGAIEVRGVALVRGGQVISTLVESVA